MPRYRITPVNDPAAAYELEADTAEFDSTSGRTLFRKDDVVVANEINVRYNLISD